MGKVLALSPLNLVISTKLKLKLPVSVIRCYEVFLIYEFISKELNFCVTNSNSYLLKYLTRNSVLRIDEDLSKNWVEAIFLINLF